MESIRLVIVVGTCSSYYCLWLIRLTVNERFRRTEQCETNRQTLLFHFLHCFVDHSCRLPVDKMTLRSLFASFRKSQLQTTS